MVKQKLLKKRILITGATGFIGSHLCLYFLKKGLKIIAQGSSSKSIATLKEKLKIFQNHDENIEYWQQNFLDETIKFPDFSDIEAIIHCAAATSVREGTLENYEKYFKLNVITPKILAKKALEKEIDHFIHLSSGQVYGHQSIFPITEKTVKNPINLYGISKLIGEHVIASFGILGLKYTIVRPFSVFGTGQSNIISLIKDKILKDESLTIYGDGTQTRAFSHVKDFCRALGLIINNRKCYSEDYNLSGPKEYSVNNLIGLISNKLNKKPNIVYREANVNEIKRNIAAVNKIQNLGFSFTESLEDFINNQ